MPRPSSNSPSHPPSSDTAPAAGDAVLPYPPTRYSATEVPPVYAALRGSCPVARVILPSGDPGYLLSRYEDVRRVLGDPAFSRAATVLPEAPKLTALPFDAGGLFTLDPPEHTRLRALVAREFTPRRVDALRPLVAAAADRLVDALVEAGPQADLISGFAFPLPALVICELLGVPFAYRERFQGWSDALLSLTAPSPTARAELLAYLAALVRAKRRQPGDDLLSALAGSDLDERELLVMAMTLLIAGHETTAGLIGTSVLTLLLRPGALSALPDDLDGLVEELLRYNPLGDGGPLRVTLRDVEVGGVVIPRNSAVIAAVGSANRDGRVFRSPDSFDPARTGRPHLAFGHGVHYCLGAALARAELGIALTTLARRLPGLRLRVAAADLRMHSGLLVNRLVELPVSW
ncbi:cytochrome P450 [Streptacidiphilus sp. PB12-B1b]|uniref:cytochrome P450 n=1 Tax=Streptacidiphilus sp. PB12-B1b TaxID=2705012 RepID=UPI0015FE3240|nr:cytochrome P450 [Streptacidiphilus sp. PB12-B1b]QMU78134.1 cytochrome P450 [Streptacidiphilus sp. PB12-B1b]